MLGPPAPPRSGGDRRKTAGRDSLDVVRNSRPLSPPRLVYIPHKFGFHCSFVVGREQGYVDVEDLAETWKE